MTFNQWWATLTDKEQKLLGQHNARFVWDAAATAEREACAKVCDELAARDKLSNYYKIAANRIRARNNHD